ncbi:pirin family protein [Chitinibacteraceae bacterium HSL-7]
MIDVRKANERGHANFGWLDSHHTFSFGNYYDPEQMGFSHLRVINDDRVMPRAGFDTHGHRDMEIISYVLDGAIEHKDSTGNHEVLQAGEFQLMSAGKGILHSEYNASTSAPLHFLQIWIEPNVTGGAPGYQQKDFGLQPGLTLIASPDGADDSLRIKQDARLYQLILAPGATERWTLGVGRRGFVHVVKGALTLNGQTLEAGDGARIGDEGGLAFQSEGSEAVQALLFDLP